MAVPSGSGYTNLSQYVNANQGNQLGNTVQSGVQQSINGLQSGVQQAQNQFNNGVNGQGGLLANTNNTTANQGQVTGAINNITNPTPLANVAAPQGHTAPAPVTDSSQSAQSTQPLASLSPGTTPPAVPGPMPASTNPSALDTTTAPTVAANSAATPTSSTNAAASSTANAAPGGFGAPAPTPIGTNGATATPNTYTPAATDVSAFAKFMQGNYAGPTQLNNYGALQAQGQNLQGLGQNLNTQGGLQSLLQQYVGGNNYNQGEQGLDTLLLGQTGKPQLQNITRSLQNVGNIPQSAEAAATGAAQQAATGNQDFARQIGSQLSGAQGNIAGNIQNNINAANTENQNTINSEQGIYDLLNNAANPDTASTKANRIGGAATTPGTNWQTAQLALQQAAQSGQISPTDFNTINKLIPQLQLSGQDPKALLAQAFAQLGGQQGQYSNYGGITPLQSAGFNLAPIQAAPLSLLAKPFAPGQDPGQLGSAFKANPDIAWKDYYQHLAAYNNQQAQMQGMQLPGMTVPPPAPTGI